MMRRFFCGIIFLLCAMSSIAMPQRIISLAPNLTEMLYAIGAGNSIVGVSVDSNYPAAATKIPIVANAGQLNLEAIVAEKPTMVIAWQGGNPSAQLTELKKLHIPVYSFQFNTISDITAAIQQLGQLTNHQAQAQYQIQQFNQKLSSIKQSQAKQTPIKVLYVLWQMPLMTVGNNTLISQAIQICGGQNIFADINVPAAEIDIASVLQRNPAIIIAGFSSKNWKNSWETWPQISAVKTGRLYITNPDLLQRPGPRFVEGVLQLCEMIRSPNHAKY